MMRGGVSFVVLRARASFLLVSPSPVIPRRSHGCASLRSWSWERCFPATRGAPDDAADGRATQLHSPAGRSPRPRPRPPSPHRPSTAPQEGATRLPRLPWADRARPGRSAPLRSAPPPSPLSRAEVGVERRGAAAGRRLAAERHIALDLVGDERGARALLRRAPRRVGVAAVGCHLAVVRGRHAERRLEARRRPSEEGSSRRVVLRTTVTQPKRVLTRTRGAARRDTTVTIEPTAAGRTSLKRRGRAPGVSSRRKTASLDRRRGGARACMAGGSEGASRRVLSRRREHEEHEEHDARRTPPPPPPTTGAGGRHDDPLLSNERRRGRHGDPSPPSNERRPTAITSPSFPIIDETSVVCVCVCVRSIGRLTTALSFSFTSTCAARRGSTSRSSDGKGRTR